MTNDFKIGNHNIIGNHNVIGHNNKVSHGFTPGEGSGFSGNAEPAAADTAGGIKNILILSANPKDCDRLRLDEEVRKIKESLLRARRQDQFKIESRLAVRVDDIRRALLDHKPQLVHFAGHGSQKGVLVEDEMGFSTPLSSRALADLFSIFAAAVQCVVLSSCYSATQSSAISKHIPYVVGMRKELEDENAIAFSSGFYDALAAGENIETAFRLGRNAIIAGNTGESQYLVPVLKKREDTNE